MRIFLFFLVLLLPCLAQAQQNSYRIGALTDVTSSTEVDLELSSANTLVAYGAIFPETKTVNTFSVRVGTVVGTLGANDVVLNIYEAASGLPTGSSLDSSNTLSAAISSNSTITFTGLTLSATAGKLYWFVVSNANGTPASNYFLLRPFFPSVLPQAYCGNAAGNWGLRRSTDGGSSWTATQSACAAPFMIGFSDSSYFGFPAYGATRPASSDTGDRVYSAIEVGNRFTTPDDGVTLNLRGVAILVDPLGTPTVPIRARLYEGTSLVATTSSSALGDTGGGGVRSLYFTSAQALSPNTTYRVVLGAESNADSSSNAHGLFVYTWQNSAAARTLLPFDGTMYKTRLDGTWTDTNTKLIAMELLLDFGNELTAAGGGSTIFIGDY